jgi:hypothetical protein
MHIATKPQKPTVRTSFAVEVVVMSEAFYGQIDEADFLSDVRAQ